jgi:hypothetical protein
MRHPGYALLESTGPPLVALLPFKCSTRMRGGAGRGRSKKAAPRGRREATKRALDGPERALEGVWTAPGRRPAGSLPKTHEVPLELLPSGGARGHEKWRKGRKRAHASDRPGLLVCQSLDARANRGFTRKAVPFRGKLGDGFVAAVACAPAAAAFFLRLVPASPAVSRFLYRCPVGRGETRGPGLRRVPRGAVPRRRRCPVAYHGDDSILCSGLNLPRLLSAARRTWIRRERVAEWVVSFAMGTPSCRSTSRSSR